MAVKPMTKDDFDRLLNAKTYPARLYGEGAGDKPSFYATVVGVASGCSTVVPGIEEYKIAKKFGLADVSIHLNHIGFCVEAHEDKYPVIEDVRNAVENMGYNLVIKQQNERAYVERGRRDVVVLHMSGNRFSQMDVEDIGVVKDGDEKIIDLLAELFSSH
jgi:hypothetical protein